MASKDIWQSIVMKPLTGVLDTRSRPADVPQAGYRWKQNWAVTTEGQSRRRGGWVRFFSDFESDDPEATPNHDYHDQSGDAEPPTTMFESIDNTGYRRLFIATESKVSVLDETTGEWTDLITGMGDGSGSRWAIDELNDVVVLSNNVDQVQYHDIGSNTAQVIPELVAAGISKAKIVVAYNGFILLMNLVQDGERHTSRIRSCDLNDPMSWDLAAADTLAILQDLDYGDEIIAAKPLLGSLYIYCRRSIWKCNVANTTEATFTFTKVYSEPENQSGCLAYSNTVVSTGREHYYVGRDSIYKFTPYRPEPERMDWLHRASGVMFQGTTALDGTFSDAPTAKYIPNTKEVWISWPSTGRGRVNNNTLVFHVEQSTADYVDHGFLCFCNFRRNGGEGGNEVQEFLGVSARDNCIKTIGNTVFSREYYSNGSYVTEGYNSILRGLIPLGLSDREKRVRYVLVDHDTITEAEPCAVQLRIGNSFHLADPNETGQRCPIIWRAHADRSMSCPDSVTKADYEARNLRPWEATDWAVYEQNRFLYFEFKITNEDGTAAIGGDTCWDRIEFEAMALPK